jgi:hypothetical protein
MRDLANAFALVKEIDGRHGLHSGGIEVRGRIAWLRPLSA